MCAGTANSFDHGLSEVLMRQSVPTLSFHCWSLPAARRITRARAVEWRSMDSGSLPAKVILTRFTMGKGRTGAHSRHMSATRTRHQCRLHCLQCTVRFEDCRPTRLPVEVFL